MLRSHSYRLISTCPRSSPDSSGRRADRRGAAVSTRLRLAPSILPAALGALAIAGMMHPRNARAHDLDVDRQRDPARFGRAVWLRRQIRNIREAKLPATITRVSVMSLPMDVAKVAQTPGQMKPGMVRQRRRSGGDGGSETATCRFDALEGDFRNSLCVGRRITRHGDLLRLGIRQPQHCSPMPARRTPSKRKATCSESAAFRRDLKLFSAIRPNHAVSRVLLARLEAEEVHPRRRP